MSAKPNPEEITRANARMQRDAGNEMAARCYEAGVAKDVAEFLLSEVTRGSCPHCALEALGLVAGNAISEMLNCVDDKQLRLELVMGLMKTLIEQATGMRVGDSAVIKLDDSEAGCSHHLH